ENGFCLPAIFQAKAWVILIFIFLTTRQRAGANRSIWELTLIPNFGKVHRLSAPIKMPYTLAATGRADTVAEICMLAIACQTANGLPQKIWARKSILPATNWLRLFTPTIKPFTTLLMDCPATEARIFM